jgi:hypothetical protein
MAQIPYKLLRGMYLHTQKVESWKWKVHRGSNMCKFCLLSSKHCNKSLICSLHSHMQNKEITIFILLCGFFSWTGECFLSSCHS